MSLVLVIVFGAYLLGSIPSGFIAGKIKGVDIRTVGSGNIGATNAFRILGKVTGSVVLICDGLKGFAAVAWLPDLAVWLLHPSNPVVPDYCRVLAGVAAVLGHNYTLWLKFKGGKGIATSAGVLAALVPLPFVIILTIWIVLTVLTRYVSVASIAAAAALPFAAWFCGYRDWLFWVCVLMAVLAIYKHKPNMQRLLNGTENKIGARKNAEPAEAKT